MKLFSLLIVLIVGIPAVLSAQEKQVKLSGSSASFSYPDLTPGGTVTVYGVSRGNSSHPVRVNVYGPKGVKVTASAAKVLKTVPLTLKQEKSFYPILLRDEKETEVFHSECVDFATGDENEEEPPFDPNSIESTWDPICDEFSAEDLSQIGEALTLSYGGEWDSGRVCGYIVYYYKGGAENGELLVDPEATPTPAPVTQSPSFRGAAKFVSKEYTGLFSKDACDSKNDKYIFRVKVKLPKELPSFGALQIRLFETSHDGGEEATIKPVSEGRFAPAPLLLMNYLGMCGERINVVRWRKDKPISSIPVKIYDLIMYRDFVLTRSPIGPLLSGGEGTFELFDGREGYGVCFQLQQTRQRANGYPS